MRVTRARVLARPGRRPAARPVLESGMALAAVSLILAACGGGDGSPVQVGGFDPPVGAIGDATVLTGGETLAQAEASGAPSISLTGGRVRYFVGYRQVTGENQNPVVLKYRDGQLEWARTDYETSTSDAAAYGLFWAGVGQLFVVFDNFGVSGPADTDFRRFTQDGWLSGPGVGGVADVSVLLQVRESDGEGLAGTFLRSQLSSGEPNVLRVTGLELLPDGRLAVEADAGFSPLKTDGTPFDCSGVAGSPISYRVVLSADLRNAVEAEAQGCS